MNIRRSKLIALSIIATMLLFSYGIILASATDSNVYYNAAAKLIVADGGNLFPDFTKMLPGDTKTQDIHVGNQFGYSLNLFLRAVSSGKEAFNDDEEKQALSAELLSKLTLTLDVTLPGGVRQRIYEGSAAGPFSGGTTIGSSAYVHLGAFTSGASGTLHAILSVPSGLENVYQNATAKVRWIFVGEYAVPGEDDNGGGYYLPQNPGDPAVPIADDAVPLQPLEDVLDDLLPGVEVPDTGAKWGMLAIATALAAIVCGFVLTAKPYDDNGNNLLL